MNKIIYLKPHNYYHDAEGILFLYKTCKSAKITAYKYRLHYWYVKEVLEYYGFKIDSESDYRPIKPDTKEIIEELKKGRNCKEIAEKYFRTTNTIMVMKNKLMKKEQEEKNRKYWLWQYNFKKEEVENWYNKTKDRGKIKR